MRIAYIAVKGIPIGGGVESVTEQLGSKMVEKGHEVTIYASRDYGTKDCTYKGMRVKTVSSFNTKTAHKLSICWNATRDVMRHRNSDVIHVHAVGPSLFSIFPRIVRILTIVQTHGLEWKRDKWGVIGRSFFRLADYTAVFFPNKTTAVSKVQKRYYEDRFGKEIVYIPNGVNPVQKRSPNWILSQGIKPQSYILFAARLVEEKGIHLLIEAFKSIPTDMQLVIAGDAAHAEKYKAKLRSLAGDGRRIIFTGFLTGEPLEELFSNAYLFCLPSTIEGLPVALLEAMNYGNCCLASDIPENLEALENYGYTFRNRDIEDLHRVLKGLIANPEKVAEKRETALAHVRRNYSWDRVADQMEALYLSVIKNR
jgi:glycosyltransferase involved in cell wall biosynthesis